MRIRGRFHNQSCFGVRAVASGFGSRVMLPLLIAGLMAFAIGGPAFAKEQASAGQTGPAIGSAGNPTVIDRVEVSDADGKTVIRAYANGPIRYFAIRQDSPPAIILNLANTRISSPIPPVEVENDLVHKVYVAQTASKSKASRILVSLKANADHEIHQTSDGLMIELSNAATGESPVAAAEETPAAGAKDAPVATVPAAKLRTASRVLAIDVDKASTGTQVAIKLDGHASDYKSTIVPDPARLVIDVEGVTDASKARVIPVQSDEIARVRLGEHPGKVRVVLDLNKENAPYTVDSVGSQILIALGGKSTRPAQQAATPKKAAPKKAKKAEKAPAVRSVAASEKKPAAAKADGSLLADLKVPSPIVPKATPVMAALDAPSKKKDDSGYLTDPSQGEILPERPEISLGFRPGKSYHGSLVSLDFKDAEIQNILRLIAEVSGLNVVAGEDVTGNVTVRLVNVPWDQALDVVLASHQMGYMRTGNIIRVAPAERLKAEEAQYLADRRSKEKLEDLVVKLQPVNYAKVADAQAQVESLLSDRGTVNIDVRTNTLIIKDIPTVIEQAVKLVRRLDTQTPQVLIEAKIIEANLDFAKELGISYTADFLNSDIATGQNATQNGADFGNRVVNSGTSASGSSFFSGALPISGTPTGIAAGSFTAIKDQLDIDVVVQALETSGRGRVISSPRITTLDNKEAKIEQGVSIPFQTTEEGDTNLEFIDANLSLTVTPHVTSDEAITMKIKVSRNAPDLSVPTATGDPAIAKNEAITEALVQNGETIVIGGIYVIDKATNSSSIPYFNKIPFLQFLFRNYDVSDQKSELIIFVTPRIVGGSAAPA